MGQACRDSDFDTLKRLGHKLKGSLRMYGFAYMGELCAGVETAALERKRNAADRNIDELTRCLERMTITYVEEGV